MKIRKVDSVADKQILTGLIMSSKFIRDIKHIYKSEYLNSSIAKTVADWCFKYFDQYEEAPQFHIQDLYNSYIRENNIDEKEQKFMESLFQQLIDQYSEEGSKINVDYLLDMAEKRFKEKSLKILAEDINANLINNDIISAESLWVNFQAPQLAKSSGVCPFTDEDAIREAFNPAHTEPLFRLPGRLGYMMNDQLVRSSLISFLAPEKRGKSFWLQELALWAYKARCNVAVFDLGDMTQDQKIRRIHSTITQSPTKKKYVGELFVPVLDCKFSQGNTCPERNSIRKFVPYDEEKWEFYAYVRQQIKDGYIPCSKCYKDRKKYRGAVWYEIRDAKLVDCNEGMSEGFRWVRRTRGKKFKISCHENDSLTVRQMGQILDVWEYKEGFIPDVIIADYADIFASEDNRLSSRDQENKKWKQLRALSQRKRCCLITATQSDSASYGKESIGVKNFSEDKRKHAHITAEYALNQTDEEKKRGILRVAEILIREGDFDIRKKIIVLQCLRIGKPLLASF
jgi:hypothetical protein